MKPRSLTKSSFSMALNCPTKLYYQGKKEYVDNSVDDHFMEALADGGFQVGEYVKQLYSDGFMITSLDYEEAINETSALLKQDNVIIFEAAFKWQQMFVRVDVVVKNGNTLSLFEVKAKSYDKKDSQGFLNRSGGLNSDWKPYLYDIAFQTFVVQNAYPSHDIKPHLTLVNKQATAISDGLNQVFKLVVTEGRKSVCTTRNLTTLEQENPLTINIDVSKLCRQLIYDTPLPTLGHLNFSDGVNLLAEQLQNDIKIAPVIGKKCMTCQFLANSEKLTNGKVSGFHECWKQQLNWSDAEINQPNVFNIWNFRRANKLFEDGIIHMTDVKRDMIITKETPSVSLSTEERQWLQVEKVQQQDIHFYLDAKSLSNEMATWRYPLNFIDFETCAVAIPFFKGMRPYEGIAFQFSHHILYEDGRLEHHSQYLATTPGQYPNFHFVRELKKALSKNEGTVFRYSNHENTFLNFIHANLLTNPVPDSPELIEFIESITHSSETSKRTWRGKRDMVDLWELVKRYFYDPATQGSNSIKAVLPAVLNASHLLQRKYSQPIYGSEEIRSLNFQNKQWVTFNVLGKVNDPYKSLPTLFDSLEDPSRMTSFETLNNGGLAQTAYAALQFSDMSVPERQALERGLLQYCELDTLAMVMLVEAWKDWLSY